MKILPQLWTAAMDRFSSPAGSMITFSRTPPLLKAAHPVMLRAIAASRKKNDRIDASKIADCLRWPNGFKTTNSTWVGPNTALT